MLNKAWTFNKFFIREVSKLFKCYVKNFDRKSAISLKTLKIEFFNTLLWLKQELGVLSTPHNLFFMTVRIFLIIQIILKPLCFLAILL